jgi:hypothetical protein
MVERMYKKGLVVGIIVVFLGLSLIPSISGNNDFGNNIINSNKDEIDLDIDYIKSIVENLSHIILTEYNESAGEIAKGRAFGTKGEHKAAEILYENMTKLGLLTTLEQINNTKEYPDLTRTCQILDYNLILKNESSGDSEKVDSFITAIKLDEPLIHEKIINFTFNDLKIKRRPKTIKQWRQALAYDKKGEDYVFLSDVRHGLCREPDPTLPLDIRIMRKFFYPIRIIPSIAYTRFKQKLERLLLANFFKNCKGIIIDDFTNDTHDAHCDSFGKQLPGILINGSTCSKIKNDIDNFTIDFFIKEMYNESVVSYNVIGLLEGKDPSKTVLVDCLYDSVWSQGTGDSAVGMGIVMGIAKYFTDNKLYPENNLKFVGFGGEEVGLRGAKYYEATHRDEDIIYMIDMNQVCSLQDYPPLTLNLIFNNYRFMNEIWPIVEKANYEARVGNTDITKRWWPEGAPSDDQIFISKRPGIKTVCFLEDFPWVMHHRDGLNHMAGDVFEHVDWNEVGVTSEIVLNITKHVTLLDL